MGIFLCRIGYRGRMRMDLWKLVDTVEETDLALATTSYCSQRRGTIDRNCSGLGHFARRLGQFLYAPYERRGKSVIESHVLFHWFVSSIQIVNITVSHAIP